MLFRMSRLLPVILFCSVLPALHLRGGDSGLNCVVVVNQSSTNSCELGNYYCERRQVPPENVLRINWTGSNISWSADEFQTNLLNPLLTMLTERGLADQVDIVVLSMDIPFQTVNDSDITSTTSALFYGLKPDPLLGSRSVLNSYAFSEAAFPQAKPDTSKGYSFLACMLTAGSLLKAKLLVDQGAASDATFPRQPVILAKSSDPLRNQRFLAFDNAIFNCRLRRCSTLIRTNSDSPWTSTNLLGYQTGLAGFSVAPNTFVPGAMADSMTSFGGLIFGPNGQTTLLAFIHAGASGSYGTVTEPLADPTKFPDPQAYFYQARGFNLAESYYQSLSAPYMGLIVGEPLAAPFQQPGTGGWVNIVSNTVLKGTVPLSLDFAAADPGRPLQQIDLFLDGKFYRTLTNVVPLPGNVLQVNLNGVPIVYSVPANATIGSIATNLPTLINAPATTNLTQIIASVHGDRIELLLLDTNRPSPPTGLRLTARLSSTNSTPSSPLAGSSRGSALSLTTFLTASGKAFLNSGAYGRKACSLTGRTQVGSWVQLELLQTNGARLVLAVTNQSASATPLDMAQELISALSTNAAFQNANGILADDLTTDYSGGVVFNLYARTTGRDAALSQVRLTASAGLASSPSTFASLTDNLSDLLARNHLYVTAGATKLALAFPLDTTSIADGFHELTAVAYEGSHVRTQTRSTIPVRIQNSSLSGGLTLLTGASVLLNGTFQGQVTANTNTVTLTRLYSTGGLLASVTNQPSTIFAIKGSSLGAGLHPLFALLQTSDGLQYRTATSWLRVANAP